MKFENEVTVEIDTTLNNLLEIFKNNGFELKEEYEVKDVYMVEKLADMSEDPLEILKKCILIRDIITETYEKKCVTYKYKEYNENREIIRQGKSDLIINSIDEAIIFFNNIGYKKLININDHLMVYANDTSEMAVQIVNDKHIYIEIEQKCDRIGKCYKNIDEMKNEFVKYNIPIKDNNYFVKKAEIEFLEVIKKV